MRLAEDRRARVPFALIGVLLLVCSTAFATTLSTRGPARTDRAVDAAMERVDADVTRAVEAAVRDAAREAAANPVTVRANTSTGRVLDASSPFRDALRVRIYVRAREHLRTTEYRRGDVTAAGSLSPTPDAESLRRAKERVRIAGRENGTELAVSLRDVSVTASRDGRVVASENRTVNVTVETPVLSAHERAERFERRLNRDPLDGPGLGRRLTARLYPVVWARAYGQYGGAPVSNVLANRHVELSTNGAVLRTQRAVFGQSDADGRAGLQNATARVSVRDLSAAAGLPSDEWADVVLPHPNGPARANDTVGGFDADGAPRPNRTFRVGVNASTDGPFLEMVSANPGGEMRLSRVVDDEYLVEIRRRTAVRTVRSDPEPTPDSPGEGWTLVGESTGRETTVTPTDGPEVAVPSTERVFARYGRRIVTRHRVERTWLRGNATRSTHATWTETHRVTVAVTGEDALTDRPPARPVEPRFERGGALGGPNLADVPARARRELIGQHGGRDVVARKATENLEDASTTLVGARPDGVEGWVAADLAALQRRVRNVSVAVSADDVATGRANPPARLAAELERRRAALVDAPDTYDGVADRARVAARATYLDGVLRDLQRRAAERETRMRRFDRSVGQKDGNSTPLASVEGSATDYLHRVAETRDRDTPPAADTDADEARELVPDGDPAYLTLAEVNRSRVVAAPSDGYHPLAARNVNAFTLPYGDAADAVVSTASVDGVRLSAAGQTLVAANRTLRVRNDAELRERRDRLARATWRSLELVEYRTQNVLQRETSLSMAARREAVESAGRSRESLGRRALAVSNGSFTAAVADEAIRRSNGTDRVERSRLRTRLRVAVREIARSDEARVGKESTDRAASATREVATASIERALATGANGTGRSDYVDGPAVGGVPAGLPMAPAPGYWYATVNVWTVQVRGAYAQFAVRTGRGSPGERVRYVRDGSVVRLDVDGDGRSERLGRNERVSFETTTGIVVAVPPWGRGVGDVDGDADERSSGWPYPGCTSPDECPMRPLDER